MLSQRDSSMRKSDVRKVFIKNLDKSIDDKALYDTFSAFGNILSCKVVQDEAGNSKGYGFVHFKTEGAANKSIEKVNGMLLNRKKVYVGRFASQKEHEKEPKEKAKFNKYERYKLYVKNLDDTVDEERLRKEFSPFGTITSVKVEREDGRSNGFGFVCFSSPGEAVKAITEMNGRTVGSKSLYVAPAHVSQAQKEVESKEELKRRFERMKIERLNRYHGVNLYVKNLDDTIDGERLREEFSPFGTIISTKVVLEDGRSKGFGFVCFSSLEEANKAVTEMNGRTVGSKPLYVALAQSKEDRKAHLASQYVPRMGNIRMQQMGQRFQPGGAGAYFIPTLPQPQRFYGPVPKVERQEEF